MLYIGGPERGPNWLPTTPGHGSCSCARASTRWDEEAAAFRIERIDMDEPRPVPDAGGRRGVDAVGGRLPHRARCGTGPTASCEIGSLFGEDGFNTFPASRFAATGRRSGTRGRGRFIATMRWKLAADEALILEFDDYEGFWMFTNMGTFWNSMDYLYRPVSYTPSRTAVDSDGRVRLVMAHDGSRLPQLDRHPGLRRGVPDLPERPEPHVPADRDEGRARTTTSRRTCRRTPVGSRRPQRAAQMHERFDAIRRRYRT